MKIAWQTKKLGDLCEITTGSSNTVDAVEDGQYTFFDRSKIIKRSHQFLFDSEALIIPGEGAQFFPKYFHGKFDLHQRAYALLDFNREANIRFVEYFLNFEHKYFERVAVGATAKSLRRRHFTDLEVPLPPIDEQKRIVKRLDEITVKLSKAKGAAEKNLQNSRELFESYVQNVFAHSGKDWEEKRLGECFKLKSGDNLTSKLMSVGGRFPVFGGNGIAGMHDKFNLSGSNIIIGRVGALCGNVRHITEEIWLTDNAFKVVDFQNEFDHSFLTYLLNYNNLRKSARQAAQPVISNSSLKDIFLQFPKSISEQKAIVKKLDVLSIETMKLEKIYKQKLRDLEELKKSVLQKAFTGQL